MLTLNLSIVQDFDSYPMNLVGAEHIILECIAGVQLSRCGLVGLPHRSRFVIEEASYIRNRTAIYSPSRYCLLGSHMVILFFDVAFIHAGFCHRSLLAKGLVSDSTERTSSHEESADTFLHNLPPLSR